jgi:uncharacterized protein YkwD
MRVWLRFSAVCLLFFTFVYAMAFLNYHVGPFQQQPQVAGASVTKSESVKSSDPLLRHINSQRDSHIVQEDARLNALATSRLADMLSKRYYAHTSPEGFDFADMLEEFGLEKTTPSCENLLMTSSATTDGVISEWLASPPHKACMLEPAMNAFGSASAIFDRQTGQRLYVTIYANL